MPVTLPKPAAHSIHTPGKDCRQGHVQGPEGSIFYIDQGPIGAPPVLLIMGFACQLTMWPETLVQQLLSDGFRVIRFDNRDIGLSDENNKGIRTTLPNVLLRQRLGLDLSVNYTLYDMVQDTVAVIRQLDLGKVHLVGASMGGMISQLTAAIYPQHVLSLCSIMSSTNESDLPLPRRDILLALNGWGVPKGHDRDTAVKRQAMFWNKISSPGIAESSETLLERLTDAYDRSYRPAGVLRQSHAVSATGGFRRLLSRVRCPTQILHGDVDPLVHVKAGIDSARHIPGAKLHIFKGMAHDFPPSLIPAIGEKVSMNIVEALPR